MSYQRTPRNSHGQFIRTRHRLMHLSKPLIDIETTHPLTGVVSVKTIVAPIVGVTYRKPKEAA